MTLLKQAGFPLAPKHHWGFELLRDMQYTGNPRLCSTAPDESFNATVGRISQACDRRTFPLQTLLRYRILRWCQGTDL